MMAGKAKLFGDDNAWNALVLAEEPKAHKQLGRSVKGFDRAIWEHEYLSIALTGSYAKFSPNSSMRDHLLATGTKRLAEASPYDVLWGIGFRADHTDVANPTTWVGQKLLASTLQEVRRLLVLDTPRSKHDHVPSAHQRERKGRPTESTR